MSIPTVAVTCIAYDQNGNPVAGGRVTAKLNQTEIYNGFVVPEQVNGVADANGVCVLDLWPNALGVAGSSYLVTAVNPDTGKTYLRTTAVVPNSACNLHEIIVAEPFPPIDAAEQALIAAQAALAPVTAQAAAAAASATNAASSAQSAASSAITASVSASNAVDAASTASTQAGIATTQAGIATTRANTATTQANTATTQASIATIQAGIATTQASAASNASAEAFVSATTATSQANTATARASEAAASATNAANSAYAVAQNADAAITARDQAVSAATTASNLATSAAGSATAAATSAGDASNAAFTATTQAGIATTQAGLAETSANTATSKANEASSHASNALASANTASTQASTATTQAGIATTQAAAAAASAVEADASADSAAVSAAAAAALLDAFDDRYLGAKASDPTVDNDGDPLKLGDQYFNSTVNETRVWNGTLWQSPVVIGGTVTTLNVTGTTTLSGLTASTALALDASKNVVSVTNTGTGSNVLSNSPTFVTPVLGTPSSGTVTNLTGTASININGTVGATTANTGAFTTLSASGAVTLSGGTANGVTYLNGSKVLTTGSALTFDGTNLGIGTSSPATKLHVVNGSLTVGPVSDIGTQVLDVVSSIPAAQLRGYIATATSAAGGANGDLLIAPRTSAAASIRFITGTTPTERARIDFNGNLGIGTTSPVSNAGYGGLTLDGSTGSIFSLNANAVAVGRVGAVAGKVFLQSMGASDVIAFQRGAGGTESMRIDSAGDVGIGTSSPTVKLDVVGDGSFATSGVNSADTAFAQTMKGVTIRGQRSSGSGGFSSLNFSGSGYAGAIANVVGITTAIGTSYANSSGVMVLSTKGTSDAAPVERMRLDSSGNLGLGVTPSAWGANTRALQMGDYAAINSDTVNGAANVSMNAFFNGTNWIYRNSSWPASYYNQSNGLHRWYTAPSGTAGAVITFTQAMTLDASGNLLVGTTTNTNSSRLVVNGTISETVGGVQYQVVSQADIGTAPNEIPLNQYLGEMAYMNAEAVVIQPQASVTPNGIGDMVFQLTNDTTLVVKVKGSDGTVRSVTLTLA